MSNVIDFGSLRQQLRHVAYTVSSPGVTETCLDGTEHGSSYLPGSVKRLSTPMYI